MTEYITTVGEISYPSRGDPDSGTFYPDPIPPEDQDKKCKYTLISATAVESDSVILFFWKKEKLYNRDTG